MKDFEKNLIELEAIIDNLENEEITFEQAIKIYEKGMKLYEKCVLDLQKAKTTIEIIKNNNQNIEK